MFVVYFNVGYIKPYFDTCTLPYGDGYVEMGGPYGPSSFRCNESVWLVPGTVNPED
jgi:hypothetical protein